MTRRTPTKEEVIQHKGRENPRSKRRKKITERQRNLRYCLVVIVLFRFYGNYSCLKLAKYKLIRINGERAGTKTGKIRASKHVKY